MTAGDLGFSLCGVKQTGFAEARVLDHRMNAARLKSCPSRLAVERLVTFRTENRHCLGLTVPTPSASSELALAERKSKRQAFPKTQGTMGTHVCGGASVEERPFMAALQSLARIRPLGPEVRAQALKERP